MTDLKRVFILGAGFSRAADMPLATELLPLLVQRVNLDEMRGWLEDLCDRLAWLSTDGSSRRNIEEVFHYAHFDREVHRLRQHDSPVGRHDGPGTPSNAAHAIDCWLSYLEKDLCDVILDKDNHANLAPITHWAESISPNDTVITFNYDTLVERALTLVGKPWNHGTGREDDIGVAVCKLHGSIDWIVAHRSDPLTKLKLLFDKPNANRSDQNTGHIEDDCLLWRCQSQDQLQNWMSGRELQFLPEGASTRSVGIAGLGAYKEVHRIPGLGRVWTNAMRAMVEADVAIVVGFSMSDFDAMAQLQFAAIAKGRRERHRPLPVIVIDPNINVEIEGRFRRVFRHVDFVKSKHETVDWSRA